MTCDALGVGLVVAAVRDGSEVHDAHLQPGGRRAGLAGG